jgi:hypothetical protein
VCNNILYVYRYIDISQQYIPIAPKTFAGIAGGHRARDARGVGVLLGREGVDVAKMVGKNEGTYIIYVIVNS